MKLITTLLAALVLIAAEVPAETVAYTGATVHPVSSESISNGTVLVRDGRIESVGPDVNIPDDAHRIDLAGLHLYPGFVHAGTALGLTEIGSVAGTDDSSEMGRINAAIRVEVAVNHDSMLLPPNVAGGLLTAHVVPGGGLIRGTSAVISLAGWNWEDMTLAAPVGMHVRFPRAAADDSEDEDLALIDRTFDQAAAWRKAMQAHRESGAPKPAPNDQFEALAPVLDGELPVFLHADGEKNIAAALDWARDRELGEVVLVAGPDVQHVASRLAADGIAVILTGVHQMPERSWEPYDEAYVAAARLDEAGVRFAITDGGSTFAAGNARHIPLQAGMAAAFGLDRSSALKSVTLWPASILGMDDELGSLEAGKRATFFAATGDALEARTRIERVWIDGREYDLGRDRQRELYERYRDRPVRVEGD